jgi:hypothetical protein
LANFTGRTRPSSDVMIAASRPFMRHPAALPICWHQSAWAPRRLRGSRLSLWRCQTPSPSDEHRKARLCRVIRRTYMPVMALGPAVRFAPTASRPPRALFSGHSLRAGFLTEAGRKNANLFKMREHSRPPRSTWSPNTSAIMSASGNMPAKGFCECLSPVDNAERR